MEPVGGGEFHQERRKDAAYVDERIVTGDDVTFVVGSGPWLVSSEY